MLMTRVIVIDPGHGGVDGGAQGGGILEKNVTLVIAKMVCNELSKEGFAVSMTRDHDTDVSKLYPSSLSSRHKRDLQNRLTLIRESHAIGAISIHVNSSVKSSDRGPLVFYSVHSEQGKILATAVQSAMNAIAHSTQRPVGRTNLFLLRHAPCPAILVEVGYLTNAMDVARLKDTRYHLAMAKAIASSAEAVFKGNSGLFMVQ